MKQSTKQKISLGICFYSIFVCLYMLAVGFASQSVSNQAMQYYLTIKMNDVPIETQETMLEDVQRKSDIVEKYYQIGSRLAIYGWFFDIRDLFPNEGENLNHEN